MMLSCLSFALACLALQEPARPRPPAAEELEAWRAAAAYSEECGGVALVVRKDGPIVFEHYVDWFGPDKTLHIGSATQSFWAIGALAAAEDGLLELDERVCTSVPEWEGVAGKTSITIRHLLQQTSGIEANARRVRPQGAIDFHKAALSLDLVALPGERFRPGPGSWWLLGVVLERKLAARDESPLDYLHRRVLAPLGFADYHWDRDRMGRPTMPWGATVTARDWSRLGQLLADHGRVGERQLISAERLAACARATQVAPAYGLGFWLFEGLEAPDEEAAAGGDAAPEDAAPSGDGLAGIPPDLVYSTGSARQRLLVLPSRGLVVVRQALPGAGWSDVEFLRILLGLERRPPAADDAGDGDER